MTDLVLSEVFGPTLQGEGPTAGSPAWFVRLGRCNLSCQWCDTPYTWDWHGKNGPPQDPSALYTEAPAMLAHRLADADRVVITGGEPMLQWRALADLVARLDVPVEIETNGTVAPTLWLMGCQFNVSPKLANSGMPEHQRIRPAALEAFAALARTSTPVYFKFVVCDPADVDEIADLEALYGLTNIIVMPEGRDADTIVAGMRTLAPIAVQRGWRLSSRQHVLIWGDERGR